MGAFPCTQPLVGMGNSSAPGVRSLLSVWESLSLFLNSVRGRLALTRGVTIGNFYKNQCRVLKEQLSFAEEVSKQNQNSTSLVSPTNLMWPEPAITELRRVLKVGYALVQGCQDEPCLKAYLRHGERTLAFEEALREIVWCMSVVFYYNSIKGSLPENPDPMATHQFPSVKFGAYKELHMLQKAALADQAELLATLNMWIQTHVCSIKECGGHPPLCVAGKILSRRARVVGSGTGLDHTSVFWNIDSKVLENTEHCIGVGGHGSVVETRWLGDTYAKKIFQMRSKEVFTEEANALSKLSHRHMVTVFACSVDSQTCSLIMERMPYDLRKYMDYRRTLGANPPFSFPAAVDLMLQLAEVIQHMHSQGMVHRDVKPANILVKEVDHDPLLRREGFVVAKLTDFGLAKSKREITSYSHLTKNQGTKRWMAPEVFGADADNEDHSLVAYPFKTDVYSFGIVCCEVLTGTIPFLDVKLGELYKLITDPDKPLRPELPESCPEFLASLIHQCWHTDPEMRPSFTEICAMLRYLKAFLMLSSARDLHQLQHVHREPGDGQLQQKTELTSRTAHRVRDKRTSNFASSDDAVFHTTFNGRSWTTPSPMPRGMPIPEDMSLVEHRGSLVAIRRRCTDSMTSQTFTGPLWTHESDEIIHDRVASSSAAVSQPAAVSFKGRLYCIYCAEDNHIRLTWSDDAKVWSEGTNIGGSNVRTLERPALVALGDFLISVIRGLNNSLYWNRSPDPSNTTTWSAYSRLYHESEIGIGKQTVKFSGGAELVVCDTELFCFVNGKDIETGAACCCWSRFTELKSQPLGLALETTFRRIQFADPDAKAGSGRLHFTSFRNNILWMVSSGSERLRFGIVSISDRPKPTLTLILMWIGPTADLASHCSQGKVTLCVVDSQLICVYVRAQNQATIHEIWNNVLR